MSNEKTVSWRDVRAKRPVDDKTVAHHIARMESAERAWRLREIRQEQGLTQKDLAAHMGITQPSVSALESGQISKSGLETLRAYVEALGGHIEVVAMFGDRRLVLSDGD